MNDIRLALRALGRRPGYAIVTIATLALGIGGLLAVFLMADPMIFRPLPYQDANRVVLLRAEVKDTATLRLHADDYVAIKAQAKTLDAVSMPGGLYFGTFPGSEAPVLGYGVDADFLRLAGVQPVLGRLFTPEEYQASPAAPPAVAMITSGMWRRAFGGAREAIGKRFATAGATPQSVEIVGVLPPTFLYPESANEAPSFIVPHTLDERYLGRANVYPDILAHVRPGFSFEHVESEMQPLLAAVEHDHPAFEQGRRSRVYRLQDLLFRQMRTPLLLLSLATAALMLLAGVNLSYFAVARSRARDRDVAVRLALGASRWRVLRLHLAEATLLVVAGSLAGVMAGRLMHAWAMAETPEFSHIYRLIPGELGTRSMVLAIVLGGLALLGIGVVPAIRSVRRGDARSLADSSRTATGRRFGERLTIAGQAAFSVGLVVACLLVVRSFVGLITADRGFDPASVRQVGLQVPRNTPAARLDIYERLVAELGRVPGVAAVAAGNGIPSLTLPDAPVDAAGQRVPNVLLYQTSDRMPTVMGMRLDEGRLITEAEAFNASPVAVVDRGAAELMWPGQSAMGQLVHMRSGRVARVVGVLGRVRADYYGDSPQGFVFVPLDPADEGAVARLSVVMRFVGRPPTTALLAAAAGRVNPAITLGSVASLSSWERLLGQPRFLAATMGLLAALTAVLAAFGLLGVVNHFVTRRTREIGIRLALGADAARVRRLIISEALRPALAGVGAGLLLAFWWGSLVQSLLVGVGPHDPATFSVAALATLAVVAIAALGPAFRASRIDPASTLRTE